MPEIRTLEEYVLAQIEEKDKTIEEQAKGIQFLNEQLTQMYNAYTELRTIILSNAELTNSSEGKRVLYMSSVWEDFEKDKFDALLKHLPELTGGQN